STGREQAGTSTREPATSTTHTRQTLTGVKVSRKHRVGTSMPRPRQASRMVAPAATFAGVPSMTTSTGAGARRSGAAGGRRGGGGVSDQMGGELPGYARAAAVCRPRSGSSSRASPDEGEPGKRGLDGAGRGLPEAADGGIAHDLAQIAQTRQIGGVGPARGAQPRQQLLLADGAHAARHALATRLVAEELG